MMSDITLLRLIEKVAYIWTLHRPTSGVILLYKLHLVHLVVGNLVRRMSPKHLEYW